MEVRKTSISEMVADPNFELILEKYGEESANGGIGISRAQIPTYRKMEENGFLHVFGAYVDGKFIGLMSIILSVLPHYGELVAVLESFFVLKEHRKTGAGLRLLKYAEQYATKAGAAGVLMTAPVGGALEKVLPKSGYSLTNLVFFKGLRHE